MREICKIYKQSKYFLNIQRIIEKVMEAMHQIVSDLHLTLTT